jgi:DNA-binding NarL/FixJ family response regulator
VAVCETGAAGVTHSAFQNIQVVLISCDLPDMSGLDCIRLLRPGTPGAAIAVIAGEGQDEWVLDVSREGAVGYVSSDASPDQWLAALEMMVCGGSPLSPRATRSLIQSFQEIRPVTGAGLTRLSDREQEVLALLARGHGYKQIGVDLGISLSTVRAHLHAVYDKLEVRTRQEATSTFLKSRPAAGESAHRCVASAE